MANVVTQWNPFIITNKGLELRQRSIATGATITFNYAKIGQGVPSNPATIPSMTDIISAAEQVPVVRSESDGVTHSVGIRIDNADFEQPVLMTEIGLFASIGQETPVLYGYTYTTQGYDSIPAGSTSHYIWTVSIDTVISRAQSISFTYDGSGVYITEAEMAASLAKKSDVKHTHTVADIADYVNPVNPYLLINPDFLVNQRGQNEYSSGYTVDGWYIEGNKCSVRPNADGILITSAINPDSNTHAFWQKIENPLAPGKYTLSLNVLEVSGVWSSRIRTVNASGDYVDSYYTSLLHKGVNKVSVDLSEGEYISAVSVGINAGTEVGNSVKLAWVKLELGSAATPFVPPDPATELLKCQRYFTIYKHQNATSNTDKCSIGVGYALTGSIVYAVLPIAAMRSGVAATVSYSGLSLINGTDTVVDFSSATALEQTDSTVQVAFTVSGQTPGTVYRLRLMNSDAYLVVSKEL
ncbi:MAG: hypothetical protein ACLUV5_00520 [Oscillospiraceae bacterium]|jgi:hypothetical protein